MKCRIIRDDMKLSPTAGDRLGRDFVRANAVKDDRGRLVWKVGTVLDDPNAYKLVKMGCAVPADDACRSKVNMTDEQLQAVQDAYQRQDDRIQAEREELSAQAGDADDDDE